ncbi:MAG: response regulator [Ancalomicrobiaceae bacterium]|nr:response regulator [Ancalomicrobiaceae bacterium]
MKRILVVDDSLTTRMFYRSVLEPAGFHVEEASNGLEGLEQVMLHRFDMAIVDVNMPKMDGYAMTEELRRNPDLSALPVLTISTEASAADAARAYSAGANYYLVKPADPTDLTLVTQMLTGTAS